MPYRGSGLQVNGLIAGHSLFGFAQVNSSAPQHTAGKLKALALINPARSSVVPSVPTLREAGMPVDVLTWFGLFTPTATPREIIQRVNAASFCGSPRDLSRPRRPEP